MTAEALARRRLIVPEVIQSSTMDCGPACLKALLSGFGIPVSYSRLRDACQTDVDGTSIDVIEDVAVRLGLTASQYLVPVDHLLMTAAAALPAIVATRLASGLTHFVVVWRAHGRLVQVMDPASGRLFQTRQRFLREVMVLRFPSTPAFARRWLTAPAFLGPLRQRIADLGCSAQDCEELITQTLARDGWLPVAALDAATRLAAQLQRTGVTPRGSTAARLVSRLASEAAGQGAAALSLLPAQYWSVGVRPSGGLELRGAVILHAGGRSDSEAASATELLGSPELVAAAAGESSRPLRSIFAAAFRENRSELLALPPALLLAGATTTLEALLLSGFVGLGKVAAPHAVQSRALLVVGAFLPIAFLLNLSIAAAMLRLQRWLELHLRIRLLDKLPRLGNYYFHSRLKSDLALRAYGLRSLRSLPPVIGSGFRVVSELFLTVAGILWLWPESALPVLLTTIVIVGLPLILMPLLNGQDLRLQTHAGALTRFYLDSLQGLMPMQAHRAERPVRAAHEALLVKWVAALRQFNWTQLGGLALGLLAGVGFAIWMVSHSIRSGGGSENRILAIYWALKLPLLAQELAGLLRSSPGLYNSLLRLFDVLDSPDETELHGKQEAALPQTHAREDRGGARAGVHVRMHNVAVQAGGHRILSDVDLELTPGEHVAIVGPSGSGKTSLVGLLLGWHRAGSGSVLIDGEPAHAAAIRQLRRETAWVDPAVQIWNRSFEQNLRYGNGELSTEELQAVVRSADLAEVVDRLPLRMTSSLGEGGGLISGGEGQRVRLARAMLRANVRLAILDEPFRGLDHDKRLALLDVARRRFSDATFIYVSHDIDTVLDFARVLVMEGGRIVEDGPPQELLKRADSRFAALRQAQESLHQELWGSPIWRRWRMEHGELREPASENGKHKES